MHQAGLYSINFDKLACKSKLSPTRACKGSGAMSVQMVTQGVRIDGTLCTITAQWGTKCWSNVERIFITCCPMEAQIVLTFIQGELLGTVIWGTFCFSLHPRGKGNYYQLLFSGGTNCVYLRPS